MVTLPDLFHFLRSTLGFVAQVSAALDEGSMEEASSQDDDDYDYSDDQMSEEDEPDDMMP